MTDLYLPEPSSHADTRSMDIEVNVTTLCNRFDRNAIAFGDGHRPLCPRHATIFVTGNRILEDNRALEQDKPEAMPHRIEREPETESPDAVAVIAERILTRLSTLDGLIEGMRSPVNGADERADSVETSAGVTKAIA